MALPSSMKTVRQVSIHSDTLSLDTTPLPIPTDPTDHLVKVHAVAPTLGELAWGRKYPAGTFSAKELVPGQEFAGTVVSAPEDSPFRPGDEVFALMDWFRAGAAREYALVRTSELALKPPSLDFVAAAAVPMSALTAWQGLFVHGPLDAAALDGNAAAARQNRGLRVLVTAAGGGVGTWAVQLAKAAGVGTVVALASGSKSALVRELGADEVLDYTEQSLADWAGADPAERQVDFVFECIGGDALAGSWVAVKEGGTLLSIASAPDESRPEGLAEKHLAKSAFFIVKRDGPQLARIARLIDEDRARPIIDSVYGFADFQAAFDKVMGGHTKGKVVINIAT